MNKSIYSLPINFTVGDEISNQDTRFVKVVIDVLHTGKNLNNSYFDKDVVNENIESIKNTPILGFIQKTSDGEKDFKGHEYIITRDENGIKREYIGSAYGVIPESCNPRWISKICEDSVEREYLQVDALVWSKFSDAKDILLRDIEKGHSMELSEDSIEGYEDEETGTFHFEKFSFNGCCILADDCQPAMIESKIEVNFTMNDFVKNLKNEINDIYTTFTDLVNEKSDKGGIETMSNTEQNVDFAQTVLNQFQDISNLVREHEFIVDRWGDEYPRYYAVDIQDNEVIVVDAKNNYNYFGFSFTLDGDKANIDFANGNRKKIRYENYDDNESVQDNGFNFGEHIDSLEEKAFSKIKDADEKVEVAEQLRSEAEANYNQIKSDYDEMKPKYEEYVRAEEQRQEDELNAQKDSKFAEYEYILGESADFAALKDRKYEMTVDEIEKECAVLYVRENRAKLNFSASNTASAIVGIIEDKEDSDDKYIDTKYGRIPVKK